MNLLHRISAASAPLFFWGLTAFADPKETDIAGPPGVDFTIQSVFYIVEGLACWATRFVLVIMVGMIIWYGINFLMSRDNPTKFTSAKKSLNHAIIGIVVILGAYTIIATVGNAVTSAGTPTGQASRHWTLFVPLNCSGVSNLPQ